MRERVTVYGAGYVGLVSGVCLADLGHEVMLVDVDRDKLEALRSGDCPFYEPGVDRLLDSGIASGRLSFAHADDVQELDGVVLIAVGTPSTQAGAADMRYVRNVIDTVLEKASPGTVVAMKSTVPPGTGRRSIPRLAERGIGYVSNPEFLREGSAVSDFFEADRVVIGGLPEHVRIVERLYEGVEAPIVECDVTSAEMIKYASNAFLATKISFINEIARLCDSMEADIDKVAYGVGLDPRIGGSFLRAGIGYGGSCFPKDTRALDFLADMEGYDFQLLRAVIDVNARQRFLPIRTLRDELVSLEDVRVAVLGLTFKPDTDDTREAPAREIIDLLRSEGADVVAFDPQALDGEYEGVRRADSIEEAVSGAEAVVVSTEWPQFVLADWDVLVPSMTGRRIVFDGRNCLDPEAIGRAGGEYFGVGRSARSS